MEIPTLPDPFGNNTILLFVPNDIIFEEVKFKLLTLRLVKLEFITERFAQVDDPLPIFNKLFVESIPGSPEFNVGLVLDHSEDVPLLICKFVTLGIHSFFLSKQ